MMSALNDIKNCIAIFILYILKINNFINVGSKLKVGARDKPAIFNAYVMSIFAKMPPPTVPTPMNFDRES